MPVNTNRSLPDRQARGEHMADDLHLGFFDIDEPYFSELSDSEKYDVVEDIMADLRAYQLYLLTNRH